VAGHPLRELDDQIVELKDLLGHLSRSSVHPRTGKPVPGMPSMPCRSSPKRMTQFCFSTIPALSLANAVALDPRATTRRSARFAALTRAAASRGHKVGCCGGASAWVRRRRSRDRRARSRRPRCRCVQAAQRSCGTRKERSSGEHRAQPDAVGGQRGGPG
jgi:hypothetical protein